MEGGTPFRGRSRRKAKQQGTCCASSRVGEMTTARNPSAMGFRSVAMMGIENASVLPEPVGAMASRCRFLSMMGMAWCWIGVGSVHFAVAIPSRTLAGSEPARSANSKMGSGTSSPFRWTRSFFLNSWTCVWVSTGFRRRRLLDADVGVHRAQSTWQ